MPRISTQIAMALVLYVFMSFSGYTAVAQQIESRRVAKSDPGVHVTIALVDAVPNSKAQALILRRSSAEPRDVILLSRSGATGNQLSAALFTLMMAREIGGDTARVDAAVKVARQRGPRGWKRTQTPHAAQLITQLLQAPTRNIAGVGTVPALEVVLPSTKSPQARASVKLMRP